jgi:hypothetical protein
MTLQEETQRSSIGDFFAVDRRLWAVVCNLGLNAAVAYLVLARGSSRDNLRSSWSVQAIEKYTGISRTRAATAIDLLCRSDLIRRTGEALRPRYEIISFQEQRTGLSKRLTMTASEKSLYEKLRDGQQPGASERPTMTRLVRKGYATQERMGKCRAVVHAPEWIWLPNTLVTAAAGEVPPIELTRQMQDPMVLRLLVDLYQEQNLREDGGVSRRVVYENWERERVGEHAQYVVWGFRPRGTTWAFGGSLPVSPHIDQHADDAKESYAAFWRRLRALQGAGLFEWVPHLFEGEDQEAESIHPYGLGRSEGLEDRIGRAAHEAGLRLLVQGQADWAIDNQYRLAPVPRHIDKVEMIGIARLRYRPHTKLTAAWWADLHSKGERYCQGYSELGALNRNVESTYAASR